MGDLSPTRMSHDVELAKFLDRLPPLPPAGGNITHPADHKAEMNLQMEIMRTKKLPSDRGNSELMEMYKK